MGRDFSIGYTESTCKGVSHIMFQMVRRVSQIEEGVDIDDIPYEDKYISIEQLARIIQELKNDLTMVPYSNEIIKADFVDCYKFYDNDTFEKVFENCKRACELFVDALIDSILSKEEKDSVLNKEGRIYWEYS